MNTPANLYPVAIVEDRYNGSYSGGLWLAIAEADHRVDGDGPSRVRFIMSDGPSGDDGDAMLFWMLNGKDPVGWLAVGNTPNEALKNLRAKAKGDLA